MVAATLSLAGFFVALYLWLWKIGVLNTLACGAGTCEYVQNSRYAEILGVPVALVGVGGYLALLVVSLVGLQPRWIGRREPTLWLAVLAGLGVAFTAYLTYLEAAVLRAWCRWCVFSAGVITAILITALVGLRPASADQRMGGS